MSEDHINIAGNIVFVLPNSLYHLHVQIESNMSYFVHALITYHVLE